MPSLGPHHSHPRCSGAIQSPLVQDSCSLSRSESPEQPLSHVPSASEQPLGGSPSAPGQLQGPGLPHLPQSPAGRNRHLLWPRSIRPGRVRRPGRRREVLARNQCTSLSPCDCQGLPRGTWMGVRALPDVPGEWTPRPQGRPCRGPRRTACVRRFSPWARETLPWVFRQVFMNGTVL